MAIQKPIFVVPYDLGAVVDQSGNAAAGFPPSNAGALDQIGMVYRSTGSGVANPQIRGDFGVAKPVDFFGLLLTNATPATAAYLVLSTGDSQSGTTYTTGTQIIVNPAISRADGMYHLHFELPSVQTFRYWAIYIYGHTGPFECGKVILGKKISFTYFYSPDYGRGVKDLGSFEISPNGVPASTPGRILRKLKMTFGWMTEAEYENAMEPMQMAIGTRKPVYACFDPEPTTSRQSKSYYGFMAEPGYATGAIKPGNYATEFELLSLI